MISALGYQIINALGRTLTWRVEGHQQFDAVIASGRQPIMAFWHGRILPATLYFRDRGIIVITTPNHDYFRAGLPSYTELGDPKQHADPEDLATAVAELQDPPASNHDARAAGFGTATSFR